ncbi:MAG: hypothetical protein AAB818_02425 [Patescibacteria group bacterium]
MKAIVARKIRKRKIVISNDCGVVRAIETVCVGFNKKTLSKLWEDLNIKNANKIEISHVKDKVYYIKNKNKEGLIEIPEIITKLGLNIMFEYLAKNPKLCDNCSLFGKKDICPKHLFV